ncbi:hypothetical protein G7054_g4798 [Neopestalotiopsis clavispora]|nr:hypothetical protein G7054_g4798 [Neopestalotiopsis clavispora]
MWLINTKTLELESKVDHETVKYAILSHTWAEDEVLWSDFNDLPTAQLKKGFAKIEKTCELARGRGLDYAWVDTCCIDKTSSAELSEAINSMFRWYKDAAVCFVYLSDLSGDCADSLEGVLDHLPSCRWLTRGWTLQELIAPRNLYYFYDSKWKNSWPKQDLAPKISEITRIPLDILLHQKSLDTVSIASRMSWAATRQTTRAEDMSYSLLGIFDINMPMLYGEGKKAFFRLQEEICRRSKDLTLFAWQARNESSTKYHGLFAEHPRDFAGAHDLQISDARMPYTSELRLTNKGICLRETELALVRSTGHFLNLGCSRVGSPYDTFIHLTKTMDGFVRTHAHELVDKLPDSAWWLSPRDVYLPASLTSDDLRRIEHQDNHTIKFTVGPKVTIARQMPYNFWDPLNKAFLIGYTSGGTGIYQGLLELSMSLKGQFHKRHLIFELRADPNKPGILPGRPHMVLKHKVIDGFHRPLQYWLDRDGFRQPKMSVHLRQEISRELLSNTSAKEGEGLSSWSITSEKLSEPPPKLYVEVRNTTVDTGQTWEFELACR